MYKLYTLLMLIFLSACVSNGKPTFTDNNTPEHIITSTHKMFVGVPMLLSLEGSYVEIGDGWAITVAHNKMILSLTRGEVIYHPTCDIALFKVKTSNILQFDKVSSIDEKLFASGYPIMLPLVFNEGNWIGDIVTSDRLNCVQSMATFNVTSGMSGGGVWNEKGNLIGVVVGILDKATFPDGTTYKNVSVWQSLYGVKDWIYENTGVLIE